MIIKRVDLLKPLEWEWAWSWPCSSEALCSWLCGAIVDSRYQSISLARINQNSIKCEEEEERKRIIWKTRNRREWPRLDNAWFMSWRSSLGGVSGVFGGSVRSAQTCHNALRIGSREAWGRQSRTYEAKIVWRVWDGALNIGWGVACFSCVLEALK